MSAPGYDRDLIAEMLEAYEAHSSCGTDLVLHTAPCHWELAS